MAEATGGAIVNADSAQVYRDLPILSAAPSEEELRRADHWLYGVLDGAQPCSAADWAELAKAEIAKLHDEGRLPILVGGTGLYLRTLLDGIARGSLVESSGLQRARDALDLVERTLEELDAALAAALEIHDHAHAEARRVLPLT